MRREKDVTPGQPGEDTKGREHRLRIVQAALGLFMRKGFHQTSMRDIAREAGVSLGNAYNHFAGKRDLILAAAALESGEQDSLIDGLHTAADAATALALFVESFYRTIANRDMAALTAEIMAEALRDPAVGAAFARNRQRLAAALTDALPSKEGPVADAILDLVEARALRDVLEGAATGAAPVDLHRMAERLSRS